MSRSSAFALANARLADSGDVLKRRKVNKRSKTGSTVGNINIFTNISEGTAFLLQGVTYGDGVELRRYNLK